MLVAAPGQRHSVRSGQATTADCRSRRRAGDFSCAWYPRPGYACPRLSSIWWIDFFVALLAALPACGQRDEGVVVDEVTGIDLSSSSNNLNCNGWASAANNGTLALAVTTDELRFFTGQSCSGQLPALCAVASGSEQTYEFAGFSTNTVKPQEVGYLGLANACRTEFGASARIATSEDISKSNLDTILSGDAWVRGISHASDPLVDVISGVAVSSGGSLSCRGFSDSTAALTVDGSDFSFGTTMCWATLAVACSIPE
jgi:hypothetical protein